MYKKVKQLFKSINKIVPELNIMFDFYMGAACIGIMLLLGTILIIIKILKQLNLI